jgi:hypothetical protein
MKLILSTVVTALLTTGLVAAQNSLSPAPRDQNQGTQTAPPSGMAQGAAGSHASGNAPVIAVQLSKALDAKKLKQGDPGGGEDGGRTPYRHGHGYSAGFHGARAYYRGGGPFEGRSAVIPRHSF